MIEKKIPLEEAHIYLLGLLVEFKRQCELAGVKYYATRGTLIGTVRHKGFIPWDDDVDMIIRREDYKKLLDSLEKNLPDGYCVISPENNKYYCQEFPKFCYKNKNGQASELCIDIFVYDKTDIKRRVFRAYQNATKIILYHTKRFKVTKELTGKSEKANHFFAQCVFRFLSSVMSFESINKKLFKTMTADDEKKCDYVTNWGSCYNYKKSTFKAEDVCGDSVLMPFEGIMINVPVGWKSYLETTYGKDVMQIPSEEKRYNNSNSMNGLEDVDLEKIKTEIEKARKN
ncbi:MAG: LicD family protein [Clostridia bacterium]|nr:LicD family protein [Clostridia bacterium]